MMSPPNLSDSENIYGSDEAIEDTNFDDVDNPTGGSQKRIIDPTQSQKRTARKPRPTLNAELLKGPKGIQVIEKHFENFKFHGKGHEKRDLNRMMKLLEYWCHRLFPKYYFEDCLTKIETLGNKKPVKTHLTKIRLDLLTDDNVVADDDEENDVENSADTVQESVPIDEFDVLIAEELEKQRTAVTPQRQNISTVSTSSSQTPKASSQSSPIESAAEIKERIERNRQIAIQKRLARIEAEEARKRSLLLEQGNENGGSLDEGKNLKVRTEENNGGDDMETQ